MKAVSIKSYAKVNLSIDVLGKRPDGYHEVSMIMQAVDLCDDVRVEWNEEGEDQILISTNRSYLPNDDKNIAYKAAELMGSRYRPDGSGEIRIDIFKRIPVAAGLAGGSGNGAAVLCALSQLWDLGLSAEELMELGAELGADVPFCVMVLMGKGTCARADGIGTRLTPLPEGLSGWILLSKPPVSVSTAEVYGGLELDEISERPDNDQLICGLRERNSYKITKNMINVLESVSVKAYPVIMYTKYNMQKCGRPIKVLMSGSGPTVFGVYTSRTKGRDALIKMRELNKETFLVRLL